MIAQNGTKGPVRFPSPTSPRHPINVVNKLNAYCRNYHDSRLYICVSAYTYKYKDVDNEHTVRALAPTPQGSIPSSAGSDHGSHRRERRRLVFCRTILYRAVLVDVWAGILRGRRHAVRLRRLGRGASAVLPKVRGHSLDLIRTSVLSTPREGASWSQEAGSGACVDQDIEEPRSGEYGSGEKGCGGRDRAFADQLADAGDADWKHLSPHISETAQGWRH